MPHSNPFAQLQPSTLNDASRGLTGRAGVITAQATRGREAAQRASSLDQQISELFGGGGGQGGGGGLAGDSRQQILDQTIGFKDQILNDSLQQQVLDRLSGVVSGENVPFNQEVRSSLLSGAADQAANSAQNQIQQIIQSAARSGLSPNDPAVQARIREVSANQGIAGQQSLQNINSQAGVVNFGAQQQAANDLARNRLAQLNLGGQFGLSGVDFLRNDVERQNLGGIQPQQFPTIGNAPAGAGPVQNNTPTFAFPRQGNINVPVAGSQGGALRFDDQGRTLISGTNNVISSPPRISEVGNTGPLSNQLPGIGTFNQFGNTAIPGAF